MTTYSLEKEVASHVEATENVLAVAQMFGIGMDQDRPYQLLDRCEIRIEPGNVVYITGGSGSGKSTLLNLLKEQMDDFVDLDGIELPGDKSLVDCFDVPLEKALYWLSLAGLSDAFALLRRADQLSDGQRVRFRLALALSKKPGAIFIDECCATLDRITAAVVAHNIRKAANRFGMTFVVATSHDDILEDLAPDVVVLKHFGGGVDTYYPERNDDDDVMEDLCDLILSSGDNGDG